MEEHMPDVIAQHGNWFDVLCYTFRAVSDPIKIIWILAICTTVIFGFYFITKIFWGRHSHAPNKADRKLYPEKKQPVQNLPPPNRERRGFYQAEKQKEVL